MQQAQPLRADNTPKFQRGYGFYQKGVGYRFPMNTVNLLLMKDDMTEKILDTLTDDVVANLTDSQKINIQILQNLTTMNTRVNRLAEDVAHHNKLLVTGNGLPSLQERMRNLEEYTGSMKYWQRFVGGAILIQTLGFMFGIVVAVVKFLPLLENLSRP